MLEKLGGLATIVIAVTVLCVISVFDPPTYIQIICGVVGSIICLFGVVFLFAEKPILKDRKVNKALKVG
jgi:hypothetical protein